MALPSISELGSMGFVYNGGPYIEVDATPNLTSPGHLGVPYNGTPATFISDSISLPPIMTTRTILNRAINVAPGGFKLYHYP